MNKIYNDINESTYQFKYDKMVFYFSSKFYLNKFTNTYVRYLKDEIMKLQVKFKCSIDADYMLLLLLYRKIEKRGFKVLYDNKLITDDYSINLNINI